MIADENIIHYLRIYENFYYFEKSITTIPSHLTHFFIKY